MSAEISGKYYLPMGVELDDYGTIAEANLDMIALLPQGLYDIYCNDEGGEKLDFNLKKQFEELCDKGLLSRKTVFLNRTIYYLDDEQQERRINEFIIQHLLFGYAWMTFENKRKKAEQKEPNINSAAKAKLMGMALQGMILDLY